MYWGIAGSGQLTHGEDAFEPMALMAGPVAVNVLYTTGWLLEVPVRGIRRNLSPQFGPLLLKLGMGLGILLSSIPAMYWIGFRLLH